jgi:hypothetical protein
MNEKEILQREQELAQREKDVRLAEKNLDTMHRLYEDNIHLTDTQHINKIAMKLVDCFEEKGHFCSQAERLKHIEERLADIKLDRAQVKKDLVDHAKEVKDVLESSNKEIKKAFEKAHSESMSEIKTLNTGRENNTNRITKIEVVGSVLIFVVVTLGAFLGWIFKDMAGLSKALAALAGH